MKHTEETIQLFNEVKNELKYLPYLIEELNDKDAISQIKQFDYATYAKLHIIMENISESHNEAENLFSVQDEDGKNLGMYFAIAGLDDLAYLCMLDKAAAIQVDKNNYNIAMYCVKSVMKMPKTVKLAIKNPIVTSQHNNMGDTFPMLALSKGYDIADECLQSYDILKTTDKNNRNFLMHCSTEGKPEIIDKFLDNLNEMQQTKNANYEKFQNILYMQDELGQNLAMVCICNKQFSTAARMLTDTRVALQRDFLDRIPGMYCAIYGDADGAILAMQNKEACMAQDRYKNNIPLYTVLREEPILKAADFASTNLHAINVKNNKGQSFLSVLANRNLNLPSLNAKNTCAQKV